MSSDDVKITRTLAAGAPVVERLRWWIGKLLRGEPIVQPEEVDTLMFENGGWIPIKVAARIAGVNAEWLRGNARVEKNWPPGFPESLRERYAWVRQADAEKILRELSTTITVPQPPPSPHIEGSIVPFGPEHLDRPPGWGSAGTPATVVEDVVIEVPRKYDPFGTPRAKPEPEKDARR